MTQNINLIPIYMSSMVSKTFAKAIGLAGCAFLTVFAGAFGFVSLSLLITSIIYGDVLSVAGCVLFAAVAWICWSVRRDTLV